MPATAPALAELRLLQDCHKVPDTRHQRIQPEPLRGILFRKLDSVGEETTGSDSVGGETSGSEGTGGSSVTAEIKRTNNMSVGISVLLN